MKELFNDVRTLTLNEMNQCCAKWCDELNRCRPRYQTCNRFGDRVQVGGMDSLDWQENSEAAFFIYQASRLMLKLCEWGECFWESLTDTPRGWAEKLEPLALELKRLDGTPKAFSQKLAAARQLLAA